MFLKKLNIFTRVSNIVFVQTRKCCTNQEMKQVAADEVQQKLLKVAIIGMPNAGKSTLINSLMDRKVCSTSLKVHTTKEKSCAVFTQGDSQIVFVDTPGIITDREMKKYNLSKSFIKDSYKSLSYADIIGVIHDVSNHHTKEVLDIKLIRLLEQFDKKRSFLVLNKIDVIKSKRKLLDITRLLTENCLNGKPFGEIRKDEHYIQRGYKHFNEIFMVSALTGSGLSEIRQYLKNQAYPSKWLFDENVWSDQTPETIIVNSVRARLLNFLPQEIPYLLRPFMEYFEVDEDGIIKTVVKVECKTERICKLVAGDSNGRLKQIIQSVQDDLQMAFQNYVRINIILQSKNGVQYKL